VPVDPQMLQQTGGPPPRLGPGQTRQLGGQQHVVGDRQVVQQIEELEDHADLRPPELRRPRLAHPVHPQPGDGDGARAGPVEPGDQVEQRRLAAAGRPQHGDRLSGAHAQGHVGEGRRPLAVRPGHIADVDDGRGRWHGASTGRWSGSARR
jgi:hypothetical protein